MILSMWDECRIETNTWFKSNYPLGAAGGKVGKLNIH